MKDVLARIPGAGDVEVFGSGDYAMRVWLNPDKLAARNLTASDVVAAIREQNVQVAGGIIGQPPVRDPVNFELLVNVKGRLATTEEFGNIIVKTGPNGEKTLLKDVARVEFGAGRLLAAFAAEQQNGGGPAHLSDTRRQCAATLQERSPHDGGAEEELSRRHGLFGGL